jgi:hypothetical protein
VTAGGTWPAKVTQAAGIMLATTTAATATTLGLVSVVPRSCWDRLHHHRDSARTITPTA